MLEVKNLTKNFEGHALLRDVNFHLSAGEIICLLGASGSGKSTLLRILAGLENADSGSILWNGRDINATPTHLRNFGLMFQDYALFSHLNVKDNIAFGLRMRKMDQPAIDQRVAEVARLAHLEKLLTRGVSELSGGEQQRVALARALAPQPGLMMLDEPLGALDRKLKETLLDDLRLILKESQLPTIYVTHDQAEAYSIADRILLLNDGQIVQDAEPQTIHDKPTNEWVARFMALGNILDAVAVEGGLRSPIGLIPYPDKLAPGSQHRVLLRPSATFGAPTGEIVVRILDAQFTGDGYKVEVEGGLVFTSKEAVKIGELAGLSGLSAFLLS